MMELKPWNGRDKSGKYQYPSDQIKYWNMQIDSNGTIYYVTKGRPAETMIWCPANNLTRHMHRLEQIAAR